MPPKKSQVLTKLSLATPGQKSLLKPQHKPQPVITGLGIKKKHSAKGLYL
jgi:hypothetical protein